MNETPNSGGLLRSFPRVFWIANAMELFERAAYYGMNSVLAIYLSNSVGEGGLGFSEQSVGFLQSLIYALTYIIPILGGALADRYGYRRMLLVAFSLLAVGYFVTGHMSAYGAVFASLLVMATGSGLFKPVISGTVARTTTQENSGFGFGIYYWMINLAAFLAPLAPSPGLRCSRCPSTVQPPSPGKLSDIALLVALTLAAPFSRKCASCGCLI